MYLPPYSPLINQIEKDFSFLKSEIKKKIKGCREKLVYMQTTNYISNKAAKKVEQNIIESLPVSIEEKCGNFYIHILDYFYACLHKEDVL